MYGIALPFLFASKSSENNKRTKLEKEKEKEQEQVHHHHHYYHHSFFPSPSVSMNTNHFSFHIPIDQFFIFFNSKNKFNINSDNTFIHSIYYFLFGDLNKTESKIIIILFIVYIYKITNYF